MHRVMALAWLSVAGAMGQTADSLWNGLQTAQWLADSSVQQRDPACRAYIRTSDFRFGLPVWCRICVKEAAELTTSSAYFAFDEGGSAVCRMTQFRATTRELSGDDAKRLYDALLERLEKRYGPGRDPGRVHEQGSAYWRFLRQWDAGELQIQLFINEPRWQAEILARHKRLVEAIQTDERARWQRWEYARSLRDRFDVVLVPEVAPVLPKIGSLLQVEEARNLDAGTLRSHIEILQRLLVTAPEDRKPVYLLAIDRLAEQLALHLRAPAEGPPRTETSAKLRYEYSHLGSCWVYTHNLLRRVWAEYPETRWGRQAFLLLQASGWYFGCCCPKDPALFASVIQRGEEFLSKHPGTEHGADLEFMLATAYETWWSLSLAPADDIYVTRNYSAGAALARQKAIAHYEAVVAKAADARMTLYAKRHLPNLKVGADTSQRWYYCIYD
jgi:hypothetical protein